ncbi:uncharacterized protein LOC115632709 [Scaptodrosophila lebanonensis]|uniref:Uncharacterized protein LOC115632709 n=1 Tax=Drosophila lebanonensis TaxID=7225 RepID=A0A6J2UBE3_DROLE|nr:uncharacterized protein LOC115632709 [Scaptodrosophila lebanonensis]
MFIRPKLSYRTLLHPLKRCIGKLKRPRPNWIMGILLVYTIMSLMIVKVASTAALYQQQQQQNQQQQLVNNPFVTASGDEAVEAETTPEVSVESDNTSYSSVHEAERSNIDKMRAKLQQLQHEQQQQYRQQQLQMQQQQLQQLQQIQHATGGETAYLLERADDTAREQPIYGTWRTKARRPQPLVAGGAAEEAHFYERLPKRSATMTPLKDILRDQLPRPPRLLSTQRPASTALLRRQYSESAGSLALRDDPKPKPFHFPYDGPLPEQFKKGAPPELNNIQDILQHLRLSEAPNKLPPPPLPQLLMMPTGLHIAGSIKNFKTSGLGNFFRGKRHKKQLQLSIPLSMPMHMPVAMPMQLFGPPHQPGGYFNGLPLPHQRVAIDQLYPFKPRSPHDINLLALQQQQLPPSSKGAKKKKKKQSKLQQQYPQYAPDGSQQHFVTDSYGIANIPSLLSLNATHQPHLKRVPFKVNLDIYPVLPPTKEFKPTMKDEMRHLPPSRPVSVLRHPFQADFMAPHAPSAAPLVAASAAHGHQGGGIYQTPFKFPTPASSLMPVRFPDQATRYTQHHMYYQPQKYPPQQTFVPEDCVYAHPSSNGGQQGPDTQSNQIMLHLNVFPKQKPTATVRASTNPFYSNNNMQRLTSNANTNELPAPPSPIEPRQVSVSTSTAALQQPQQQQHIQMNQTQQQANHTISRSDNFEPLPLLDFEHPIVAADLPPELPQPAALTGNHLELLPSTTERRNTFRHNSNAHIDQLAVEAQTASLFRFPVEDLIQFQVDDAL